MVAYDEIFYSQVPMSFKF